MFAICDAAVLTAVTTMSTVYWDATPCILVEIYQLFGQTCCLYLQGRRVNFLFHTLFILLNKIHIY